MFRHAALPRSISAPRGAGLFRRTYEATLGTRERRSHRFAAYHPVTLDDLVLDEMGYDRRTLENHGGVAAPF